MEQSPGAALDPAALFGGVTPSGIGRENEYFAADAITPVATGKKE